MELRTQNENTPRCSRSGKTTVLRPEVPKRQNTEMQTVTVHRQCSRLGLGELSSQMQGIKKSRDRDPKASSTVHQGSETGTIDKAGVGVDVCKVKPVRASVI